MGLAYGPLYSIPAFGGSILGQTGVKGFKRSSAQSLAGSATGIAFQVAIDVYAKSKGLGTIGQGRLLLVRTPGILIPTLAAHIPLIAYDNINAPPPTEHDHVNSPWYFSVAQALTGGFGVGTWTP